MSARIVSYDGYWVRAEVGEGDDARGFFGNVEDALGAAFALGASYFTALHRAIELLGFVYEMT